MDIEEFESDENIDHKFGDIGYVAKYRDLRSTTGRNSESTDDVWQYLNEDGTLKTDVSDGLWEYGVNSYTGRWAYPTITKSDATEDLYLYDWTDTFCSYIEDINESNDAVLMCTGYDMFNYYTDNESEAEYTFEK